MRPHTCQPQHRHPSPPHLRPDTFAHHPLRATGAFLWKKTRSVCPIALVKSLPGVLWASNRGGCPHGEPTWGSAGQNQQPPCLSSSVSSWEKCQQSSLASQGAGSAGDFCEPRGESHRAEPPLPGLRTSFAEGSASGLRASSGSCAACPHPLGTQVQWFLGWKEAWMSSWGHEKKTLPSCLG